MRTLKLALVASSLVFLVSAGFAVAELAEGPNAGKDSGKTASSLGVVQQYCMNIRDAAADARIARQMEELRQLEGDIELRISALDARQAEFEEWLQRREALLAKGRESLVAVYASMRPDAAAIQLAILDAETAASVLVNLQPRVASGILNEMDPQHAARLALTMAGTAETAEVKAQQ